MRSPAAAGDAPDRPTGCSAGCRDFADVKADGVITKQVADEALCALEIDYLGLDPVDRRMMAAIIENYNGGPVGLETLRPPSERSP